MGVNVKVKYIFTFILYAVSISIYAQIQFDINTKHFKGNVLKKDSFTRDYFNSYFDNDSIELFVPETTVILKFENNLKAKIKTVNKEKECQTALFLGCPVVHKHLSKYFRKYAGAVNKHTQKKYLLVSFKLANSVEKEELLRNNKFKDIIDGCSETFVLIYDIENNQVKQLFLSCE